MRVTAPAHDADPNGTASWDTWYGVRTGTAFMSGFGERVMRMSSSLVAPSAVAILSTVLLCALGGTAMSQTGGSSTTLPTVTVVAPKRVARPHRPVARPPQVVNTVASRPTSPTPQTPTAQTTAPAQGSVMAKIAALEKT